MVGRRRLLNCLRMVLVVLLPVASMARAATVQVPADQPTIQAGIDAASVGDTVLVGPGTYSGMGNCGIDFGGRDLVLTSSDGSAVTVIQGPFDPEDPCPRGFIFQGGESAAAVVDGFTIRGFDVLDSPPADGGSALLILEGAAPTIRDCVFEDNQCTDCDGGAVMAAGGTFERCTFLRNYALAWNFRGSGGAISCRNSTLIDCIVRKNLAAESQFGSSYGGGVACGPRTLITGCTITENTASVGGGVSVWTLSGPLDVWIVSSTIADNNSWEGGSGLFVGSSQPGRANMYLQQTVIWSDGDCGPCDLETFEEFTGSLRVSFICCDLDTTSVAGSGQVLYGPHTISEDPLFCDPLGCDGPPFGGHNYLLTPESPCRVEDSPCGALIGASDAPCEATSGASDSVPRLRLVLLDAPRPNPAAEWIRCSLELPTSSPVRVEVFDVAGTRICEIANGEMAAGAHDLRWDLNDGQGRPVAAGVYWVRVATGRGVATRSVVVSR